MVHVAVTGSDIKRSLSQMDKLSGSVNLCTIKDPNSSILLLKFDADCENLIEPFCRALLGRSMTLDITK